MTYFAKVTAILLCCALSACATTGAPVIVKVPIPIVCAVATPTRPAMPTETLPARPLLDALVQAALAEIELREGYESELLTALVACQAK